MSDVADRKLNLIGKTQGNAMGRNSSLSNSQGGRASVTKFQPTYRMESKNPFNQAICEQILKQVIDKAMIGFEHSPSRALEMCEDLSDDIKTRVKNLEYDRYKIICTVTIGERFMQCFQNVLRFFWDTERDGFASYIYNTPAVYVIGTIFAVYLD